MTKEELLSLESYEIKLNAAGKQTNKDGSETYYCTANVQLFDMEKKVTLKAVSGITGEGSNPAEAEKNALDKACGLLGGK